MSDMFTRSLTLKEEWLDKVNHRATLLGMTTTGFIRYCVVKEMERLEELEIRRKECEARDH